MTKLAIPANLMYFQINLALFILIFRKQSSQAMHYDAFYGSSLSDPAHFWLDQASKLNWFTQPESGVTQNEKGFYEWFRDGVLNLSYLCLDTHIQAGNGQRKALIYDSPVSNTQREFTYEKLHARVAAFAGGLQQSGIRTGDTVIIYMPMIPEAVIAMLACARIGAIHSVVFGGFAPHELALRIDDCKPKAIITASHGIEIDRIISYPPLVRKAMEESHFPPEIVVLHKRPDRPFTDTSLPEALDFEELVACESPASPVHVPSTHPLYILYTSGTTGKPKGVLRDTGGYATALHFSMESIYNVAPNEAFFAASDLGWVVGHSFIAYGPLIRGCTTILYEGKPVRTPDAGAFWRLISTYRVTAMFTAPTAIRAIRKEDPEGSLFREYDLSSLRTLFLAGERCDPSTYEWIRDLLGKPVVDHWWQTESGWPMLGIMTGATPMPERTGSAGKPICGYDIRVVDEEGHNVAPKTQGFIAIKLPLPPGCLTTLWNNDERFVQGYLTTFPGFYVTGDGGYKDEDGYFYILGRVDDVINVAGHRLSTGEMEEIIATHPGIAECAVVGIQDELRGQVPLALTVLKDGTHISETQLEQEVVALIRDQIGAVACLRHSLLVARLPKTRSGKILRKTIRDIADGSFVSIPSTIEDATVLDEIREHLAMRKIGVHFQQIG